MQGCTYENFYKKINILKKLIYIKLKKIIDKSYMSL